MSDPNDPNSPDQPDPNDPNEPAQPDPDQASQPDQSADSSTEGERDQGKPLTTKVDSMEEAEGWTQPEVTNKPFSVSSEPERAKEREGAGA